MLKILNIKNLSSKLKFIRFNRSKINECSSIKCYPSDKLEKILIENTTNPKECQLKMVVNRTVSIIEDLVIIHIMLTIFAFISLSLISYVSKKFNL